MRVILDLLVILVILSIIILTKLTRLLLQCHFLVTCLAFSDDYEIEDRSEFTARTNEVGLVGMSSHRVWAVVTVGRSRFAALCLCFILAFSIRALHGKPFNPSVSQTANQTFQKLAEPE